MPMTGYLVLIQDFKILKSSKKTLFFFTTAYPYGSGEAFVKTELERATEHFKKVFLFPFKEKGAKMREISSDIEIINPTTLSLQSKIIALIKNSKSVFYILRLEYASTSNKRFFLLKLVKWCSRIADALLLSSRIKTIIDNNSVNLEDSYLYAFWMKEWTLSLAILKYQKQIDHFIFRCNGIDIYDERRDAHYMPFKTFNYMMADKVIPNSNTSAKYLINKGIYPEKVHPFYLGTTDKGINPLNHDDPFLLVSCSNTSPVKRLDLIPKILQHIEFELKWLHIGGRKEELQSIINQSKSLPKNIQVEFTGYLEDQKSIFEIYKNRSINLFINTSSTEGLPVSIQEAISFGIPCIATNVGGVNEVVNSKTGILIVKNFDPTNVAKQISEFAKSEMNTHTFRKGVRSFWEKTFQSQLIYPAFIDLLQSSK